MFEGVEDKTSRGMIFVDITLFDKRLNVLVDTGASYLFMSKKTTRDLTQNLEGIGLDRDDHFKKY